MGKSWYIQVMHKDGVRTESYRMPDGRVVAFVSAGKEYTSASLSAPIQT